MPRPCSPRLSIAVAIVLAFLLTFQTRGSVGAAASLTFQMCPEQPVAGVPATLQVETWATGEEGPDLDWPIDMTGYPFDVRVYADHEFPRTTAPDDRGFAVEIQHQEGNGWSGSIVFPSAGRWFVVFRNWFPPLTMTLPHPAHPAVLEVQVLDTHTPVVFPSPTTAACDSARSIATPIATSAVGR